MVCSPLTWKALLYTVLAARASRLFVSLQDAVNASRNFVQMCTFFYFAAVRRVESARAVLRSGCVARGYAGAGMLN